MRDTDQDIAELDRLLGTAKAEYQALRHQGDLPVEGARVVSKIFRTFDFHATSAPWV